MGLKYLQKVVNFRRLTEHLKDEGYVLVFRLLFLVNKTTTVYLKDSIFVLVFTPQDNLKDERYVLVFRILFLENKTTSLPKRFLLQNHNRSVGTEGEWRTGKPGGAGSNPILSIYIFSQYLF